MVAVASGFALILASMALFWRLRPKPETVGWRTNPNVEPYIVLAFVAVMALGLAMIISGLVD